MTSINKKVAGVAALGATALAIGLGVSTVAQADETTPTATSTTSPIGPAAQQPGGPGHGMGKGFGPGGRHGFGVRGDLSELAGKLGVSESKLRDALAAVRDDLRPELRDLKGTAKDGSAADREAMRTQLRAKLADALGKELGIDSAKVSSALAEVEAAEGAAREERLDDRLAQAVKDGTLTQAEADAVKKAVEAGVIGGGHARR